MPQIAPQLKARIENEPTAAIPVIIRVSDDLDACAERLKARGMQIRRKLLLIRGLAVTATGSDIKELSGQDWITHIEVDGQVHTMQ